MGKDPKMSAKALKLKNIYCPNLHSLQKAMSQFWCLRENLYLSRSSLVKNKNWTSLIGWETCLT